MVQIAALAAVSKQTVYKHFADKQALFTEILVGTVNESASRVQIPRSSGGATARHPQRPRNGTTAIHGP